MKLRRFRHLSKRFFVALWPVAPSSQDLEWAESLLWEGERGLFATLPNHDQRHLIGVARRVDASLGDLSEERWIAAALLHDVGKAQSGLGPIRRAFATIWIELKGVDGLALSQRAWSRRVYVYFQHPSLGCEDIRSCGGHEEAALWAKAHDDPKQWSATGFPSAVIDALTKSDDD
ncbi:MAG: HD domain-containing protein [Actinobacteria bacterium]|uniref:Unannotated protein n=1 Tax=freshwater metagenome TaxID=449393 RepID=A0A6J6X269_9ZZZZ|nr:HD domain-containing protein [Actinomycetota bacterium]MSX81585.1 HD domain-containing protein [Actinomycetota bacterium]